MRILKMSLLALTIIVGIAAPAAARNLARSNMVCATGTIANDNGSCAYVCQFPKDGMRDAWQNGFYKPIPPATTLPPQPTAITTCTAKEVDDSSNGCHGCTDCIVTICGPAPSRTFQASKPARSPCAQPGDPCHQKSSTVIGPGLLEGDTGIAQQAPAAAGTATTSRMPTGSTPAGIAGRR